MPKYIQGSVANSYLQPGEYNFHVVGARGRVSSKENYMIELKLQLDGGSIVYDNLVFTPKSYFKIDQFRASTGETLDPGAEIDFDADSCLDRYGWANIIIDEWEGKKRNAVKAYIVKKDEKVVF
jgi:hypothetical protein